MNDDIKQLADDFWEAVADREPTYYRHLLGDYSAVGRFTDPSRAADEQYAQTMRTLAARAEAVDEESLDDQDRLTRDVALTMAAATADLAETPLLDLTTNPISGVQIDVPIALGLLSVPDQTVADQMPELLDSVGTHLRQLADRVREAADDGRVPADYLVSGTITQLEEALATPLADDEFVTAVQVPDGIDESTLRHSLAAAVERSVRPGLQTYLEALRDVLPRARTEERCGLSWIAGGEATYDAALRYFTTTDLTAEEIHEIGHAQVARLADEYRALGPEVVGTDDLQEIFEALRSDPALHFEDGDEIVEQSRIALSKAEAAMGDWFEVTPEAPCEVKSTDSGAIAFYFPPAADGSRGGTFFVNVADPSSWGRFEVEGLAFHEGVPGHHLQLSVASELPDSVPRLHKYIDVTAYTEGWGLYAERLGDEMGLYSSPLDLMGLFAGDSMRACRLVVDTGLHALGWSRQQAVDYLLANSPYTEEMCRPEIDRYVAYPGQATAYMIGRLEIQRIRAAAEQRQGDRFDVRAFHSAVLDQGALPLRVLDRVVAARLT